MRLLIILIAIAMLLPAFAHATGEIESLITDRDRDRIASFDEARKEGLEGARAGGSAEDLAIVDEILARPHVSFEGFDMTGDWQCRTIKLAGPAPLVVYGWFRCRVSDDGSGWRLQKLSGSQRTTGRFFTESDTALTYLGTLSIGNDAPVVYGSDPDADQIGRAYRTGPDTWHIAFPYPRYESRFDLLEFRR